MFCYPASVRNAAIEVIRSGTTAIDLTDRFEISRATAYKWLRELQSMGENVTFLKRPDRAREKFFARLVEGASVQTVSEELGISEAQLRRWHLLYEAEHSHSDAPTADGDRLPVEADSASVPRRRKASETTSDILIRQLKTALAEKTLEADFFRDALREVKARRQQTIRSGEKPSTDGSDR
jgi:transposase-like protein